MHTVTQSPLSGAQTSGNGDYPASSGSKPVNLAAALILLLLGVALAASAKIDSIGLDESFYIPAGISYLRQADPRINYEHPPLMKLLAGVPAVLAGARACTDCQSWKTANEDAFARDFLHPFQGQRLVWLARLPMVAITLLMAWSVFLYARMIAGPRGGLLSLLLVSTYPLVLGLGFTVMNDVLVTLFTILTCMGAARIWRKPGWRSALLLGGSLGLALLSKFSALILLPYLLLCWGGLWIGRGAGQELATHQHGERPPARQFLLAAGSSILIACALTWVVYAAVFHKATAYAYLQHYAFEAHQPFDPAQLHGARKAVLALDQHPLLQHALVPMLYYVSGVIFVDRHGARPSYLLGQVHYAGTWNYFPVLALVHSPPGFLIILALGCVVVLITRGSSVTSPEVVCLALFVLLFGAVTLSFPLNIGLRHFMPVLVGLMILASLVLPAMERLKSGIARKLVGAAIVLCIAQVTYTAVTVWPFYLPYCNFLRLGHPPGWISSDSNVDYGFYMPEVHRFAVVNRTGPIAFVPFHDYYFNIAAYIPEAREWECNGQLPQVRWVVVSANRLYNPYQPGQCDALWRYKHENLARGSMVAFDLSQKLPSQ